MNENTWLIQRLKAPRVKTGGPLDALHNLFCFGGGGGRLSDKAWELLGPIFSFDYMGAAEYEFGAVPEALSAMIKARDSGDLIGFEITIPHKTIDRLHFGKDRIPRYHPYGEKKPKDPKPAPNLTKDPIVYVIGNKTYKEDITDRIKLLAKGKLRIRDNSGFSEALDPIEYMDRDTLGWLELNNGFLFTIDKAMYEGMKGLFQI